MATTNIARKTIRKIVKERGIYSDKFFNLLEKECLINCFGLLKGEVIILKKISAIFAVGLMLLFTILAGCSPQLEDTSSSGSSDSSGESTGQDTFNIGLAISMTGGTALFGEGVKRGAELAIQDF